MTQTQLDLILLADLESRYNIKRPAVYGRLARLNITPTKIGRRAYIKADELERMDELDQHLQDGGTIDEFNTDSVLELVENNEDNTHALAPTSPAEQFFFALAQKLSSPLANYEALEKAANHGWKLPTSELAPLLGISARTLQKLKSFERKGFKFSRDGRDGVEIAWRIEK